MQSSESTAEEKLAMLEAELAEEPEVEVDEKELLVPLGKRKVFIENVEIRKGLRIKNTSMNNALFKVTAVRANGKVTLVNKRLGRITMKGRIVYA